METGQKKKNWISFWMVAAALMAGLVLGAFLHWKLGSQGELPQARIEEEPRQASEPLPDTVEISPQAQKEVGISAQPVSLRSLQDVLSATGVVSEDPLRVAHIRPLARGVVEKAYVRLGDRVSKGDPLVEYDNIELGIALGEYRSALAELQRSRTDLEVKRNILERGKEMLKVGAIARTAYDLREAEYKDAEARTAGAQATLEKVEEQIHRYGWTDQDLTRLSSAQNQGHTLSHSVLRAPLSGVITNYHASVGEAVEPSTELLAITDISSLWVLADIFEKDLAHIRTGKAVRIRVASYPGRTFPGNITYISDTMDPKTRTVKVRCVVENSSGLLKLEMFATVEIPIDRKNSVLAVPDSAIQQIDGKSVVFVQTPGNRFQRREIQAGIASGGYTEIRSGVAAGETIVSDGSFVVKTAFFRDLIGGDE